MIGSYDSAHERDSDLVSRFLGGDERAFDEIVTDYQRRIYYAAFAILRDRPDAEEVTQDAFMRAYEGMADFRAGCPLFPWLYRIATNLARNRYWYWVRRRKAATLPLDSRVREQSALTFNDLIAADAPTPGDEASAGELPLVIDGCMARLKSREQEILRLLTIDGLTYEEVSQALGKSIGTVKSRVFRARESLRRELLKEYSTGPSGFGVRRALQDLELHPHAAGPFRKI